MQRKSKFRWSWKPLLLVASGLWHVCMCVCELSVGRTKKKTPKTFYGTRPLTLNQHCKQRPTRSRDSLQQFSQDVFSPHLAVFLKNPHISVSDLLKKAKTLLTGIDPYTEPALSQCVCVCVFISELMFFSGFVQYLYSVLEYLHLQNKNSRCAAWWLKTLISWFVCVAGR